MAKQERSKAKLGAAKYTNRHISIEVVKAVEGLALRGWKPTQIYEELQRQPGLTPKLPSVRTVQTIVKETLPHDTSERWSLADGDGQYVLDVFEVLAAAIEATKGRKAWITRAQATWITRIRRAAPDLAPWRVYFLAMQYQKREEAGADASDLDAYLAYTPWCSPECTLRYQRACEAGYILEVTPDG